MPYYDEDVETERVIGQKYVIYTGAEEWQALYIDGELACVGDTYLVDETVRELLGCVEVASDAYFLGGRGRREEVPGKLEEVEAYRVESVANARTLREQAGNLRAQAAKLEAEAKRLETRAR